MTEEETKTEEKQEEKPEEQEEKKEEEQKEEEKKEEPAVEVKKPKVKGRLSKFLDTKMGRITLGIIGLIVALIFLVGIKGAQEPLLFGLTPIKSIFIIAIVLSLFVSLVYKYMTDQTLMKELKKDLKKYQNQMKLHKNDMTKLSAIQKEAMAVNMKYMKQSFKPMLITMIPFFAVFGWLRGVFDETIVIPLSFWPGHLGWIGTYVILSLIYTTIIRKIMRVV